MKIFCCFTQLYRVFFKLFWWIETSQFLFYSFFSIYLNSFIKHTIFSPGFVSFTNVENKGECIFPLYVLTKIFNKFMSKKDFVQVLKFIVLSDLPDPLFRIRPEQNPDLFFLIKIRPEFDPDLFFLIKIRLEPFRIFFSNYDPVGTGFGSYF